MALSTEEKHRRKVARKQTALNEKALKDVGGKGSIYESLAEIYTPQQAEWYARSVRASMIEHLYQIGCMGASRAMKAVELYAIEHEARKMLGDEVFTKLREHCHRTYQDVLGYGYSFWADVLSGNKRIVLSWVRVPANNTLGFTAVPELELPAADWKPLMTKAEFYERWPYKTEPEVEHDDGGLFDRVMKDLAERSQLLAGG